MPDNERGPIELRSAPLTSVDYPNRMIELVAVPYNEWATVEHDGRLIEEQMAPGAFGAVDQRAARRRMMVNLEHDRENFVGRVVALHPNERDGLHAELLIRRGMAFDQVLDDAADGMYAASIGFAVGPRDAQWEGRSRRRILKAYLDHIALTVTPAYAGAEVLAVRAAPIVVSTSATPNLDRILAERGSSL